MKDSNDKIAISVFNFTLCVMMAIVAWCINDHVYSTLWLYSTMMIGVIVCRDILLRRVKDEVKQTAKE
jgi:hypothetical protein